VGGTDHRPLGTHFLDAAQQELAEAACLFDLPEHRFHDLLPEAVSAAPSGSLQFASHGLRQLATDPALGIGWVLGPSGCHIGFDAAGIERGEVASLQ